MNALQRPTAVTSVLILLLSWAGATSADSDSAFRSVARDFVGFSMISNAPPLPDVKFNDGALRPVSLLDFKGKVLLINFWATWCTPCVRELPVLNDIQRELGSDRFQVVAIASGQQVGKKPTVFLKEHELEALDLYLDPHARLMTMFGSKTLPTTLVVDRHGRILGGVRGEANWNAPEARAVLQHLITE